LPVPQGNSCSSLTQHIMSSQQQWLADIRIPWPASLCASCPGWHRPCIIRRWWTWTRRCLRCSYIP
jgi:hypothetical protein